MENRIHVIDSSVRRRARVAREFSARELYAEIYEDIEEFSQHAPGDGILFAADDLEGVRSESLVAVLKKTGGSLPVVLYAEEISAPRLVGAVLEGALDYLHWPFDPGLLDATFKRLAIEGVRRSQREELRLAAKARVATLSRREREALVLLVQGMSNREMAEELGISPRTVEIHRGHMMNKLRARSASDAVRIALYADLDIETESVGLRAAA